MPEVYDGTVEIKSIARGSEVLEQKLQFIPKDKKCRCFGELV